MLAEALAHGRPESSNTSLSESLPVLPLGSPRLGSGVGARGGAIVEASGGESWGRGIGARGGHGYDSRHIAGVGGGEGGGRGEGGGHSVAAFGPGLGAGTPGMMWEGAVQDLSPEGDGGAGLEDETGN